MNQTIPLTRTPRRVKLRVENYLALDAAGAFEAYGKTELIDGEIVYMNAQHRPHGRAKMALYDQLSAALRASPSALSVAVEVSVSLGPYDGLEPDLTLTNEPDGPGLIPVHSVALVIEIADTTLRSDLTRKATSYARGGVPEYWVVDIKGSVVHQMWRPAGDVYLERREIAFGERIEAVTVIGVGVDTTQLG